jgi:DNA-binding transcriptional LysR family regulator
MQGKQLSAVVAFSRVAHYGSFTRAAAELGITPSALSQTVRALETQLGVRLLHRTTRKVAVSEHGAQFLAQVRPALESIGHAFDQLDDARGKPGGTLRLSLARVTAQLVVMPMLAEFAQRYPELHIELAIDEGFTDLIADGFDAGLRLGEALAQDMVAVPVSPPLRMAVVATPGYLRRRGRPRTPEDLRDHDCVQYRYVSGGGLLSWEFERRGRQLKIDVGGRIIVNDHQMMLEAAHLGLGLAYVFDVAVADDLRGGRLERVLDDWCEPFPGFFAYYPSRTHLPLKLRVFIDFLQERLRTSPRDRRARRNPSSS